MNNEKIGNFIKQKRKEKNLTQKQLADQLNITDRAISRWERGIGCPDISLLEELAQILDVTVLELLKGEQLEQQSNLTTKDLIESMHLGKENIITILKLITNYLTIFIISTLSLYLIITNLQSIHLTKEKHNYTNYLTERQNQITSPPTRSLAEIQTDLEAKIELISNNQGNYQTKDYSTIKTHINLLKDDLTAQKNEEYLQKKNYTWEDLVAFYMDHQNLLTPLVDHKDLYSIIISYQPHLSDNLITYSQKEDSIREAYFQFLSYLEQPYHAKNILPYKNYEANPFLIIEYIYNKELQLVNDLIEAGDIQ